MRKMNIYQNKRREPEILRPHRAVPRIEIIDRSRARDICSIPIPTMQITASAWNDRHYILQNSDQNEVGYFGVLRKISETVYRNESIVLFDQKVWPDFHRIDEGSQSDFVYRKMFEEDDEFMATHLHLWGHKHPGGMFQPSGYDERKVLTFDNEKAKHFFMEIMTATGRITFVLYRFELGYRVYDCPWEIVPDSDPARILKVRDEMKEKVKPGTSLERLAAFQYYSIREEETEVGGSIIDRTMAFLGGKKHADNNN